MSEDKFMNKIVNLNKESELTQEYHHLKRDTYNCWRIRFTIRKENGKGTKRMNYSLKTKCFETAKKRRDKILADLDSKGLLKKRRQECRGNKYELGSRPRNPHPVWEHWEWRNPEDAVRYAEWLKLNPIECPLNAPESAAQSHSLFGDDASEDSPGHATGHDRTQGWQNIQGGRGNSLLPSSIKTPIKSDNK